jgi:mono/diheme cytochrome c family protein
MKLLFSIFLISLILSDSAYGDSRFPITIDSKEQILKGKILYNQNCASCHKKDLSGTKIWRSVDADGHTVPPPLNGTAHTWHHPDKLLHQIIKYGFANLMKDYEGKMYGFSDRLSDQDIDSILAYIKSHWPEEIYKRHLKMSRQSKL